MAGSNDGGNDDGGDVIKAFKRSFHISIVPYIQLTSLVILSISNSVSVDRLDGVGDATRLNAPTSTR